MPTLMFALFGAFVLLCSQASQASRFSIPARDTPAPTPIPATTYACESVNYLVCEVLDLVNEERINRGLNELTLHSRCQDMAQNHAEDMAENNYFSHTSPYKGDFSSRVDRFGLEGRSAENIARGTKLDSQRAMRLWMNSPGHRKNILSSAYHSLGVGIAVGIDQIYFVQCFNSSPLSGGE